MKEFEYLEIRSCQNSHPTHRYRREGHDCNTLTQLALQVILSEVVNGASLLDATFLISIPQPPNADINPVAIYKLLSPERLLTKTRGNEIRVLSK